MSWKATLDGAQVKQLRHALTALSKIGTDLLIEAVPSKLILRTLNQARSAFVAITFGANFFDSHAVYDSRDVKSSVLIKHALVLLRTHHIQRLVLQLDGSQCEFLLATVITESGLQKAFRITCLDAEILQATVDRNSLPTSVVAHARELSRLLSSFQAGVEEVTLIALPEGMHGGGVSNAMQLHSYLDPSKRMADASLQTQISVNTDAVFQAYQHAAPEPADVTFNLKDFRVMLAWCMAMEMDVTLRFVAPGSPLLVEPHCLAAEVDVEAQLVLATLLESQAHRAASRQQPGTLGPTGMRTASGRASGGRFPPTTPGGESPASVISAGMQSGGRTAGAAGAGPSAAPPVARRSRFAPQGHRQPSFETPYRGPEQAGGAEAEQPALNGHAGAPDVRQLPGDAGVLLATQRDGAPGPGDALGGRFDDEQMPLAEGFEDDDVEDEPRLRSRYDPRALAADDDEDGEDGDAIPGTP